MPYYMLLLYDDPTQWPKLTPEQMQQTMAKYGAWRNKPFFVDGKRLAEDAGRVMRGAPNGGAPKITDGPYSETKEVLGGYYVIEAGNYDEAVQRTLDHPHLEFGTIEVRHVYGT